MSKDKKLLVKKLQLFAKSDKLAKFTNQVDSISLMGELLEAVKSIRTTLEVGQGVQDIKSRLSELIVSIQGTMASIHRIRRIRGVRGKKGEKGDKGDRGEKGDKGDRGLDGRNGIDADATDIITRASKIASEIAVDELRKLIPEVELDTPEQIADKLEELKGDKRLGIGAIKDLADKLKELEDRPIGGGGGGVSKMALDAHFIDDETPTGSINGTNKAFVLANTPNPTSSLKVYLDGQRMSITEDYTFSGRTITFLTAPLTGSILKCDYKT